MQAKQWPRQAKQVKWQPHRVRQARQPLQQPRKAKQAQTLTLTQTSRGTEVSLQACALWA